MRFRLSRPVGLIARFGSDERGATAIEYSLIAAAVFFGIIGPLQIIASKMDLTYGNILGYFDDIQ
jgi:Flp pilus assembly pilin Flp